MALSVRRRRFSHQLPAGSYIIPGPGRVACVRGEHPRAVPSCLCRSVRRRWSRPIGSLLSSRSPTTASRHWACEHPRRLHRPDPHLVIPPSSGSAHSCRPTCQVSTACRWRSASGSRHRDAGLLGVIVGLPAARLKGLYLAIATLASQFVLGISSPPGAATGGASNSVTAPFSLFGLTLSGDRKYYYVVLFYLVIMYVFAANLVRTRDMGAPWWRCAITIIGRDHRHQSDGPIIGSSPSALSSLYAGCGS